MRAKLAPNSSCAYHGCEIIGGHSLCRPLHDHHRRHEEVLQELVDALEGYLPDPTLEQIARVDAAWHAAVELLATEVPVT